MALLDVNVGTTHRSCGVFEKRLLLAAVHQAEKITGLGVVILVILAMIPVIAGAAQLQWWFFCSRLFLPFTQTVGFVAFGAAKVTVDTHCAITVKAVNRAARRVNRDLRVVHTQAIALGVAVGEQSPLQHLVR